MPIFDKESATSIYHQVAGLLRDRILNGELEPGAKLPPELELAETYDLSRGTIRQAVLLLVAEGLVERVQGKGTFVRQLERGGNNGGVIGITLPYAHDALAIDILLGAESATKSRGYSLLFSYTDENIQQEAIDIQRMRTEKARGFIIFPSTNVTYDEAIWQLRKEGFPFVLVDRYFPGLPSDYVGVDNLGGAFRVTEHLINLGHQAIAFIGASDTQTTSVKDRFHGYKRALAGHGLVFQESWHCSFVGAAGNEDAEVNEIRSYLSQPETPRAVVAVNDYTAIKVVKIARSLGLRVPEDVAIVGFDDIQQASQIEVPLTTVAQPRYEIGVRAAHLLIDRLKGVKTGLSQLILPTSLVVRESCGARMRLEHTNGKGENDDSAVNAQQEVHMG